MTMDRVNRLEAQLVGSILGKNPGGEMEHKERPKKIRFFLDASPRSMDIIRFLTEKGIDFDQISTSGDLVPSVQDIDSEEIITGSKEVFDFLEKKGFSRRQQNEQQVVAKATIENVMEFSGSAPIFDILLRLDTQMFLKYLAFELSKNANNAGLKEAIKDIKVLLEFSEDREGFLRGLTKRKQQRIVRGDGEKAWWEDYDQTMEMVVNE